MTPEQRVFLLTVGVVLTLAFAGMGLGLSIAWLTRVLVPNRPQPWPDRPSALPAYRIEANKAKSGVWR